MTRLMRVLPMAAAALFCACSKPAPESTAPRSPIYDNLGSYHHQITTKSPEAQKYFDQGLTLSYAFNHAEAIRSFRQGIALDADCAMCYWGVAFAYGPNINAPITEEAAKEGFAAIEQARMHAAGATDAERAYIEALAKRYVADPKAERPPLDKAYADAMREVVKTYPDDLDATTLFAQSLMDTSPWNYWEQDGSPRQFTNEVIASLESVLARDEVMECYLMTGDADYLLRVVVSDVQSLERFIVDYLAKIPGVASIKSSFALKQVKYKTALPLNAPARARKSAR